MNADGIADELAPAVSVLLRGGAVYCRETENFGGVSELSFATQHAHDAGSDALMTIPTSRTTVVILTIVPIPCARPITTGDLRILSASNAAYKGHTKFARISLLGTWDVES
jgi:hypothetical protein